MIKQCIAAIVAIACLCGARIGYTASDDNFYEGKTIRLIVAFSAGGGYDAYSRAVGRHLGKHIPGNPTIIVENMTGAGGIIHANFMYQAKPDGLIIGNNAGGLILQQIMGAKGIEFDGKKFEFLGAPGSDLPEHRPAGRCRGLFPGAAAPRQGHRDGAASRRTSRSGEARARGAAPRLPARDAADAVRG